jgi:hypothetical protein
MVGSKGQDLQNQEVERSLKQVGLRQGVSPLELRGDILEAVLSKVKRTHRRTQWPGSKMVYTTGIDH